MFASNLLIKLGSTQIPGYMHQGLVDYIVDGKPPGGFLIAVLTNDLKNACQAADDTNRHLIYHYVEFLWNHAPAACWGSLGRVKIWIANRGISGLR